MTGEQVRGKILSLCDFTARMVQPWAHAGYECYCVDLQHPPGAGQPADNIRLVGADITRWIPPLTTYAMIFAFPPCTDLAVSGARHFQAKGLPTLLDALAIVEACRRIAEAGNCPYMIENPISTLASYWRKPDYVFNPCDYGAYLDPPADAYTKKTCLWTGGGFIMPPAKPVAPVKVCPQGSWVQRLGGPSQRTKNARSATPTGFAQAVCEANARAHAQEAGVEGL